MFLSGYQKDTSWDLSVQTGLERLLYNEALLDSCVLSLCHPFKYLCIFRIPIFHSRYHTHLCYGYLHTPNRRQIQN